jgi:hypothetical protein
VGFKKFLFCIDDLDRCAPDRVVEVLKAINLIITSGDETDRSFFVLGYDLGYILKSVEVYYKDLAKSEVVHGENFGIQYLKKMVTLSVSVPMPTKEGIENLLKGIDNKGEADTAGVEAVGGKWWLELKRIPWQLAADIAFLLALVLILTPFFRGSKKQSAPAIAPPHLAQSVNPTASTVIQMPEVAGILPNPIPWWMWSLPLIGMIAVLAVAGYKSGSETVEESYVREPEDSPRFRKALEQCAPLLPTNPRDLVRMINRMRMEFLVQNSDRSPFSRPPLDEWECISYTLVQQRHPRFFIPLSIAQNGAPSLADAEITSDLQTLISAGAGVAHFKDSAKLHRYVEINRFLLDDG